MKYALIIVLFLSGAPARALAQKTDIQARIDSLQNVVETTDQDTAKALALCSMSWQLRIFGRMDAAQAKVEAGLKLAREADFKEGEANCLTSAGVIYAVKGEYVRALDYFRKGLNIHEAAGNLRDQVTLLNNIGGVYSMQGAYDRALDYYQRSLKIYERTGNQNGAAGELNNIGIIFEIKGDKARALDYYQRSLKIYEDVGNRSGQAKSLGNIGNVYLSLNDKARALDYYQRSLKIYEDVGNRSGQANSLGNIAGLYNNQGKIARSLAYFQKCLEIQTGIGDRNAEASSLARIAELKIKMNLAAEARRLAARALRIATEIGALEPMQLAAHARAEADSALGDWKSAYEHYKLFKQYSDSLNSESQAKEIGRLEAQYEFDKEIEERERLEAEEAERRAMFYWIAAGVFAALLLVAGLLTWGFRTKLKANKQLALQNAEITQQSEEISQQRDELHAMNAQVTEQRDVLEKAHEEITDSIDYASRIQHALLPSVEAMQKNADVYVYYNARDVVSGDFYWTHRIDEDSALYSAADCTGHGVPGAFMSVLGATTLDTIVREYGETSPDKMLGLLDKSIRASLKQDESKDGSLDGMDLALIKLDKKNRKLYFSSAGRPLFLLRNGEILEYKGAKFPAGGAQHGEKEFPLIEIDLEPGDRIFVCSDGVTDQFGGPRKRKFSPRRLKETLLAHQDQPLQTQGAAFAQVFDDWQKSAKQLDDQLLIGLGV